MLFVGWKVENKKRSFNLHSAQENNTPVLYRRPVQENTEDFEEGSSESMEVALATPLKVIEQLELWRGSGRSSNSPRWRTPA